MIIRIYGEKGYNCEIYENEDGEYEVIDKNDNIDEVDFSYEQGECGFADVVNIYLK